MESKSKKEQIEARTLAGFRDVLPTTALVKERMLHQLIHTFQSFGYNPIETPHLEYTEVLIGKGSDEINKQLYRFKDNGGRDVTLRFDHTVPLARFVTQNKGKISRPFKRYAYGNVFRGESPQAGRYREFTQCDFDYIGVNSLNADVEIIMVMVNSLWSLGLEEFQVSVNSRKALQGLCTYLGVESLINDVLVWIDKINKIGISRVRAGLIENVGIDQRVANSIIEFICTKQKGNITTFFDELEVYKGLNPILKEGIEELQYVVTSLDKMGLKPKNVQIDLSIARGLGYYTGIVYETFLTNIPSIGSVASGGRYNNLTKSFSTEDLPGVGASIGLDRLITALEKLNLVKVKNTSASVLIVNTKNDLIIDSMKLATKLREHQLNIEVFPDIVKVGKQFNYAFNQGHEYVIIYGDYEKKNESFNLTEMATGEKFKNLTLEDLISKIKLKENE